MKTSNSGLLLLLVAVVGLAGFLTGNLDKWMAYLFDPGRPAIDGGSSSSSAAPAKASSGGLVSLGSTIPRQTA